MSRGLIINVDSDGVVYNMQTVLANRAKRAWPDNGHITDSPHSWSVSQAWQIDEADVRRLFEAESKRGLFSHGEAYPGAIEAVRKLSLEHRVRIVTNKGAMNGSAGFAIKDTVDFYDRHGLLMDVDLVFVRDSHKESHRADVVIDDHPGLTWAQPNALNLLFNRPWNVTNGLAEAGWRDANTSIIRAYSWDDVLNYVSEYEAGHLRGDHEHL